MTTILFNAVLATFASFAAFGCLVQMTRKTNHAIRLSVFLITVALVGQALGVAKAEWATWLDTLLLGGIFAFLLGNRRLPIRRPCPWCQCASIAVSTMTILWVGIEWGIS